MMKRDELVAYLDEYLRVAEIEDSSQNGLQVEGPEEVTRVAFATDGCLAVFEQAVSASAQLVVVHHGLFWGEPVRLTGRLFRAVRALIQDGCGLYAAHLPLDIHPEVGNCAELARLLGLCEISPFGKYRGVEIGYGGVLNPSVPVPELAERVTRVTGEPVLRVLASGPAQATRVGCVSGSASFLMDQVAAAGFDTFVTGETNHGWFHSVSELGLNVIYGGHYATETLGVKALARHLEGQFGLETHFVDAPTGM
jgi:dinuclear metal center YbgI/SA1388 family protein